MQTPTQQAPIRIMVVDDHALIREGIALMIATQSDLTLAAEAASGVEAIARFREERPDVTLMDLQMTAGSGIDAIISIRSEFPAAKIIVLTTYGGDALAQRALKAGAQGYILKNLVRRDLFETIRAVHNGSRFIEPEIAAELAHHLGDAALTLRETEVLALVATGNSNKRVAVHLDISEDTAKAHVKSILSKLGAKDRTHAVTIALRRGIIQL
jgi:DNA-binding NarL/FixJ family response regulator